MDTAFSKKRQGNLPVAHALARKGYAVFACRPSPEKVNGVRKREKSPYLTDWQARATTDPAQIERWSRKYPSALWGLPTGKVNGLAVLDIDRKKGKDGFATLRAMGLDPYALSPFMVETPTGGLHVYFQWRAGMRIGTDVFGEGLDLRGEGGYVIGAGSSGPLGHYRAIGKPLPRQIIGGLPEWPQALPVGPVRRKGTGAGAAPCGVPLAVLRDALMAIPNDGSNPDTESRDGWLAIGMALHHETEGSEEGRDLWHAWSALWPGSCEGATDSAWDSFTTGRKGALRTWASLRREAMRHGWQSSPDDPLEQAERARKLARFDCIQEGEPLGPEEGFELDEDGVIRAFTASHKDELRFDHAAGSWFRFDGNVWRREETKLAHHYARDLATRMADDNPKAKALRKVNVWEAIERGARTAREFVVKSQDWNRDLWLLGTPGGTVDLRTGVLRPGNPEDHISRLTKAAPIPLEVFEPMRDCPRWLAFLAEALGGDAEAIRFLRMWGGYSLTGDTREHVLLFVYGVGGSGKSTAINTMADIVGEYAITMDTSTLTAQKHEAHKQEIARLDGARLAWASETEKGRAWAENRIKSITGGDTITANFMRQNSFEFKPQLKLTIVGNNAPALNNVDEAMRRRFRILPFNNTPKRKDPKLPEKLRLEWPGILSWMIQGCLDWQSNGLTYPKAMQQATDEYFDVQDVFGQWIEDCCEEGKREAETTANLWASWSEYAYRNGEDPGNKKRSFPEALHQRGYEAIKDIAGIRGRGWRGLRVIKSDKIV